MTAPGKHAPASSKSFLVSLGTAIGGAVVALAVVVGIALVALNAGSDDPVAGPSVIGTPTKTTPPPSPTVVSSPSPSATATSGGDATPVGQTTLRILNGSGTSGVAAQMAKRAKEEGYPEAKVGNTTRSAKSTVYYSEGNQEEAEEFRRRFPEFTEIAPAPSTFKADVMLTVVIGSDYPTAASSPSPTASP